MRLHRGGNRQLNAAFHRIVVTQIRTHPPAQHYIARKITEGKTKREAIRCLKRHLVRTIYNTMTTTSRHTPTPALALTRSNAMSQENLDLVNAMFAARKRGDFDGDSLRRRTPGRRRDPQAPTATS